MDVCYAACENTIRVRLCIKVRSVSKSGTSFVQLCREHNRWHNYSEVNVPDQ